MQALISIIVPVYNKAKAIDQYLGQLHTEDKPTPNFFQRLFGK